MRTWDDYILNTAKQKTDLLNRIYYHIFEDFYNWPQGIEWMSRQTVADAILDIERQK